MGVELIISESLFTIIVLIAVLLWREFFISRNGILRKIFLWYFAIEVWVFGWSAVYWYLAEVFGNVLFSVGILRLIVLIPKAIIKLVLLWYLVRQRQLKNDKI